MRVERFEDLIAWQKARAVSRNIYAPTRKRDFGHDFGLINQMQRADVSVMANLAEGFDREGAVEFHRFVAVARASCSELKSHMYVALDVGYISNDEFSVLAAQIDELTRTLGALRRSLKARTAKA
jgi:four helix bundle protein